MDRCRLAGNPVCAGYPPPDAASDATAGSPAGKPSTYDRLWQQAVAAERKQRYGEARHLLRRLAHCPQKALAARAGKRLARYRSDPRTRAAIARAEKDARCHRLRNLAVNYLKNQMKQAALAKLKQLATEAPHPDAAWARQELEALR